jgi:M6 family metalloprotease-like protein
MILSLCFGARPSPMVRAQAPGPEMPQEPSLSNSQHVEKQAWSQSGWFSILWGDSQTGNSRSVYTLTDSSGQTTVLSLDETLAQSMGGVLAINRRFVTVQGIWPAPPSGQNIPAALMVTSISLATPPGSDGLAAVPSAAVTGSKPWVSIMCKFSDYAVEPKNLAYFQGMYSSVKPGLDHYWREQSYDLANVAGSTASGWFVLPHPESTYNPTDTLGGTDLDLLANDCIAAADDNVDYSLYTGINMMFNTNFDNGYAWGGSRFMNLDGVIKSWSTTWEPPWGYEDITVIAHEMGHGFGLPHSSGNYGQTYDNQWDVMSDTWSNCINSTDATYGCLGQQTISYHKDKLGWIPAGQKFTAGLDTITTITIEQLDMPQTGNYLMAQIPIGGSSTHFYTVEARRKTGYDVKLPGQAVIIHDVDTKRNDTLKIPAHVVDADGNGNTGDAGAMWTVGETFLDSANSISVTVVSATATGFQVTISTMLTQTLTVDKTGTGSGTVTSSPAGIDCGATCSYPFSNNTSVTLTAVGSTGSVFTGWSGSGCSGLGTCNLTMDAAKSVTASFALAPYKVFLPFVIR